MQLLEKIELQQKLYKICSSLRMVSVTFLTGYLCRGWYEGHVDVKLAAILAIITFVNAGACDFLED